MSIKPGTRIGPYEVTSPLGEGGMGVVFRACHLKLKCEVAIKILPDEFARAESRSQSRRNIKPSKRTPKTV
jgi:serine/threonine protein kinase